jgi:ankyrin repeat protein
MTIPFAYTVIRNGDLDALIECLDAGTDPNTSLGGYTLLMHAACYNQSHIAAALLSRGANVHQKNCRDGRTALHYAAMFCPGDVFYVIFSAAGPRAMNFLDNQGAWTPFHKLVLHGSAEEMAFALSHPGIDTSTRDRIGRTPLEINGEFLPALQTYRDQEARWQPMRYTWIKLLLLPTRG